MKYNLFSNYQMLEPFFLLLIVVIFFFVFSLEIFKNIRAKKKITDLIKELGAELESIKLSILKGKPGTITYLFTFQLHTKKHVGFLTTNGFTHDEWSIDGKKVPVPSLSENKMDKPSS